MAKIALSVSGSVGLVCLILAARSGTDRSSGYFAMAAIAVMLLSVVIIIWLNRNRWHQRRNSRGHE